MGTHRHRHAHTMFRGDFDCDHVHANVSIGVQTCPGHMTSRNVDSHRLIALTRRIPD